MKTLLMILGFFGKQRVGFESAAVLLNCLIWLKLICDTYLSTIDVLDGRFAEKEVNVFLILYRAHEIGTCKSVVSFSQFFDFIVLETVT